MNKEIKEVSPEFIKDLLKAPLNKNQQVVVNDLVEEAKIHLIDAAVNGYDQLAFPKISEQTPKIIDAWVSAMKKKGFKIYRYSNTPCHHFIQLDGS